MSATTTQMEIAMSTESAPDYRCPGCNAPSGLIVGPTQAFCTNEGQR